MNKWLFGETIQISDDALQISELLFSGKLHLCNEPKENSQNI